MLQTYFAYLLLRASLRILRYYIRVKSAALRFPLVSIGIRLRAFGRDYNRRNRHITTHRGFYFDHLLPIFFPVVSPRTRLKSEAARHYRLLRSGRRLPHAPVKRIALRSFFLFALRDTPISREDRNSKKACLGHVPAIVSTRKPMAVEDYTNHP